MGYYRITLRAVVEAESAPEATRKAAEAMTASASADPDVALPHVIRRWSPRFVCEPVQLQPCCHMLPPLHTVDCRAPFANLGSDTQAKVHTRHRGTPGKRVACRCPDCTSDP